MINIRGILQNDDPSYRYKMEKVSMGTNGVKLTFTNINNICGSLQRSPEQMVSYFKKYFGASFEYKESIMLTTKKDLTNSDIN